MSVIDVAVAVIENARGEICITRRHPQSHQGGLWEFPGGKLEAGESVFDALVRETREELDIEVLDSIPLLQIRHDYGDREVCLHVHRIRRWRGEARAMEGQPLRWLAPQDLLSSEFPEANHAIIEVLNMAMQLPDKYLITGKFSDSQDFMRKLESALERGFRLIQLRLKKDSMDDLSQAQSLLEQTAAACEHAGAKLMLNLAADYKPFISLENIPYAGIHADSGRLQSLQSRPASVPAGGLFCASCHNPQELAKAQALQADFVVLSPVQPTASHPDMPALGWPAFADMVRSLPMPVYALGGVGEDDLETAFLHGASGVAAISAFWEAG